MSRGDAYKMRKFLLALLKLTQNNNKTPQQILILPCTTAIDYFLYLLTNF